MANLTFRKILRLAARALLVGLAMLIGGLELKPAVRYLWRAHRFQETTALESLFPGAAAGLHGSYRSLDLARSKATWPEYFLVCFVATVGNPTLQNHGHAYVAWARIEIVETNKTIIVKDY